MKLLVCDVEGTIFKTTNSIVGTDLTSTIWQSIPFCLGEQAVNDELNTHHKWSQGGYKNYIEWMKETIDIHIKYGLKQDDFEHIINTAVYNDGVIDFFNKLNRNKYIPVLISGGFQNLSQRAQIDLRINHSFSACTYFFSNGKICGYNLLPSDFQGKYSFLQLLLKEFQLNDTDWIFIGDGKNDIDIARKATLSFGISPHFDLSKEVDYIIKNFIEISKVIDVFN